MKQIFSLLIFTLIASSAQALTVKNINNDWTWGRGFQPSKTEKVTLPHTWNIKDAMFGDVDYYRGICKYSHKLDLSDMKPGQRAYLRFKAAQTIADVCINKKHIAQHRGGYTAFVVEITDHVTPGSTCNLDVFVNNAQSLDIAPVCGDFNCYGGLTRDVELLITDDVNIRPDFYASDGVFISQSNVTDKKAELDVKALLSARKESLDGCTVKVDILEGDKTVATERVKVGADSVATMRLTVNNPHLWDGVNDPYMYTAVASVERDGQVIDSRTIPIGLRYYTFSPDTGLSLNGHPYRLNGVNRHEEIADYATVLTHQQQDRDLDIIQEMGCNAVRLCHYPQSDYVHDAMDCRGLVAWVEIPFVNVYVGNNEAFEENLRHQLHELIYQKFNHPCILTWGLYNEVGEWWMDHPREMVGELARLAHELDPSRPTTGATNQNDPFHDYTDVVAYNKYFGWYSDEINGVDPAGMGKYLDSEHSLYPNRIIGISEYGAGADVKQQQETLQHPEPWGHWHPENWQTYYHIENYRQLKERDYLWCNLIWCMFDFTAAGRREGTTPGRNDKGLVTSDRQTRKDAFYFYKANWNPADKFVYIAGKRCSEHKADAMTVTAFSNVNAPATLYLNGKEFGTVNPDEICVLTWENVPLQIGKNEIVVKTSEYEDRATFTRL